MQNAAALKTWIKQIISDSGKKTGVLNFIFCEDEYLRRMNEQYLSHKTYTDIITFDQSDKADIVSGDIYISIDRVKDNAQQLQLQFSEELPRVMIHGVLHLLGWKDKTTAEKKAMREKEDECLMKL